MRSFLKDGGNDVFAQGNKLTLMKGNRNIEQRGPLGKTLQKKRKLICLLLFNNGVPFVSISTIKSLMDTIIFQPMAMFRTSRRVLFVHITIMKDKYWLCSVAGNTDMDEHVEKMVKQFTMMNASPSTCVRMLH
jgi:hypothetical protein